VKKAACKCGPNCICGVPKYAMVTCSKCSKPKTMCTCRRHPMAICPVCGNPEERCICDKEEKEEKEEEEKEEFAAQKVCPHCNLKIRRCRCTY